MTHKYYLRVDKHIVVHGIDLGPVLKEYVAPANAIFGSIERAEQNERDRIKQNQTERLKRLKCVR